MWFLFFWIIHCFICRCYIWILVKPKEVPFCLWALAFMTHLLSIHWKADWSLGKLHCILQIVEGMEFSQVFWKHFVHWSLWSAKPVIGTGAMVLFSFEYRVMWKGHTSVSWRRLKMFINKDTAGKLKNPMEAVSVFCWWVGCSIHCLMEK